MAKRAVQSIPSGRVRRQTKRLLPDTNTTEVRQSRGGLNYKRLFRKIRGNPLMLNAGIGIGAFVLVRFAIRYYKGHPEIADFLRENLDTVEDKFREYRSTLSGREDEYSNARH